MKKKLELFFATWSEGSANYNWIVSMRAFQFNLPILECQYLPCRTRCMYKLNLIVVWDRGVRTYIWSSMLTAFLIRILLFRLKKKSLTHNKFDEQWQVIKCFWSSSDNLLLILRMTVEKNWICLGSGTFWHSWTCV